MISATAEYALRAAVFLATNAGTATTETIAAATHVPTAYLHRILRQLHRAEILVVKRGPGGGFAMVRPAEQISVLDVVNAVEPVQRIRECPLDLDTHAGGRLCPLHRRLDRAMADNERAFAETSLAELIPDESEEKAAECSFPCAKPGGVLEKPGGC